MSHTDVKSTDVLSVVRVLGDGLEHLSLCDLILLMSKDSLFHSPLFHNMFTQALEKEDLDAGNGCTLPFRLLL